MEKWTEIEREVIDKVIDFMNERVENDKQSAEFFQIMDDLVLPILESCLYQDVINDKHLDQHLKDLKRSEKTRIELKEEVEEVEYTVERMRRLIKGE